MYFPPCKHGPLLEALSRLPVGEDEVLVLFVAEEAHPDLDRLVAGLRERRFEFCGGVFPGVIHGERHYRHGTVAKVLPRRQRPFVVRRLDANLEFPEIDWPPPGPERPATAVVLVDGLASNISGFLSELYHRFGDSVHYFGGGAGRRSLRQSPCLLTRDGVLQDAAVVCLVDLDSRLGVRHGWRKLMGPLVATRTRRNVIAELNWRPALDVYREVVEKDTGQRLTEKSFFDPRQRYPFGIHREGCEDVVRDPIAFTDRGELVCVGDVPENAVLNVLTGRKGDLVEAAGRAVRDCRPDTHAPRAHCLVADCLSRSLFLERDFGLELRAVKDALADGGEGAPQGALTIGEISSYGDGTLEFLNMTIVTGHLHG